MEKQLENYNAALEALTAKMKELREEKAQSIDQQLKICQAMREIAKAMVVISKPIMASTSLEQLQMLNELVNEEPSSKLMRMFRH